MILDKYAKINANHFEQLEQLEIPVFSKESLGIIREFMKIENIYRSAMKEINTKLEILDDEFQVMYDHNPIHHIECRLKTPTSIVEKLKRKQLQLTLDNIVNFITDIAGLRVICPYIDDIYKLTDYFLNQTNMVLVRQTDYIKHPKENGYRSMHLIIRVPVGLSNRTELVPVEIQLRTIAMDMWASLEHELHYKSGKEITKNLSEKLKVCSEDLLDIDLRMQAIYRTLQ